MANPVEIKGKVVRSETEISIIVDNDSEGSMVVFDDGQPISAVVWDSRPLAELPLIEQLSEVQQLDRSVIVQGLKSKGAIANKEDFLNRLSEL